MKSQNSQSNAVSKPPVIFSDSMAVQAKKNRVCQKQPLPSIGEFEVIILNMKVTYYNDNHYAHNIISVECKILVF